MDQVMKWIGLLVVAFTMWYIDILILIKIYNLTILPLGGPALNWWKMYGVCLFTSALTFHYHPNDKTDNDMFTDSVKKIIIHTSTLLLTWLFVHIFFG